ncbi:hypothetical protein FACS1894162_1690 [Bacteroidia bacterium]|nr:hypothetical protein FACS1894162_1690 [Bacteroidia bacterium]
MKQTFISVLLSFLSVIAFAHDDVAYRTASGWSIDYGNNATIDKTYPVDYAGSVATFFADYDGDGYLDLAKVSQSGSYLVWNWYLGDNTGNFDLENPTPIIFGIASTDKCVVGDFNGDGKADIAVARTAGNSLAWYIDYAPCDQFAEISGQTFGLKGDIPVAGDLNADGIDDVCVFRPSEGKWYASLSDPIFSGALAVNGLSFGVSEDKPLLGDFNGDGYADMAVYRPSENKIYVNLFSAGKSEFEGYAGLDLYGTIDQTVTCPVSGTLSLAVADFNYSRPTALPLAGKADLGEKVNLRHGWTCIFDNSLDVDKWVQAWQDMGINYLEYHTWIRVHDEVAPQGDSWNTYVGDDRLWTSKAKMKEKINKFKAAGGRSTCYTGIYASSPAFALDHPNWVMRDNSSNMLTYGGGYLYLMSTNENVNSNYTIDGTTFKNFNDYFVDQAIKAQEEFNWDGYRWDWYGTPGTYKNPTVSGNCDFLSEIGTLTDRLDKAVKNIRPDVSTTTLELPNAYGDTPLNNTAAVVDHQFLELWPEANGTGDKYSDLYYQIYKNKSKYPDKPLFANFYPPSAMNLQQSWSLNNIDYQFATCLAAGGYPSAQVVDGIAGFTDPVPFHAVRYSNEILTELSKWNRFAEAYGGYFYYSNLVYLIRDAKAIPFTATGLPAGVTAKVKERMDKRTGKTDAVILNLIDYGTTDLKWTEVNQRQSKKAVNLAFSAPGVTLPTKAYWISLAGRTEIDIVSSGTSYLVRIPELDLFGSLVIPINPAAGLPVAPIANATTFQDYPFQYDAKGETLYKNAKKITVIEDQTPLVIGNNFDNVLSSWEKSSDAYSGNSSIVVKPGKLHFNSTSESAIRIPIKEFTKFSIAVKGNNASSAWFGFRLLNPSTTSSIWTSKDIYYRIGAAKTGLQNIVLSTDAPSNEWTVYERDIFYDVKNHPTLTISWQNAIITGVFFGPVAGGDVQFDSLEFINENETGIPKIDGSESTPSFFFNPVSKELSLIDQSLQIKNAAIYNSEGKQVKSFRSFPVNLSNLPKGIYVLDVSTDKTNIIQKISI